MSNFIPTEQIDRHNDKPSNERYRQFKVDEQPVIEPFVTIEHKDYEQLIKENNIKPIKRKNDKIITIDVKCPCCGAPKEYLWNNTDKQNQFKCKVCSYIFSIHTNKDKDVVLKCPHCTHVLDHRISREDFDVYFCRNPKCFYYLNNLASLTFGDRKKFQKNPS